MDFIELVHQRRSVRRYQDRPVEWNKIQHCLEAARLAPSACNAQPWKFIILQDPQIKRAVAQETFSQTVPFNRFVLESPVIVVITIEKGNLSSRMGRILKNKKYSLIDIGIAAQHFCLQATNQGLGTCIIGWFNEKPIKKILGIPKHKRIGLLITLGYPAMEQVKEKDRKPINLIVGYDRY